MPNGVDTSESSKSNLGVGQKELSSRMFRGQSWSGRERHCLFLNHGGDTFQTASHVAGFDFADDGRGMSLVDWDHDGDLDLWLSNRQGPQIRFLENQSTNTRWLSLKLSGDGQKINRDAIGTVVTVHLLEKGTSVPLRREVAAGAAFLSQSSLRLNYGLGAGEISGIGVRWPDGTTQELPAPTPNKHYTLSYGETILQEWKRPQPIALPASGLREPDLSEPTQMYPVGSYPLPPLGLTDAAGKSASLPNKLTLVKLWASWCDACHADLAKLPAQLAAYKKAGITVALVNAELGKTPISPVSGLNSLYASEKGLNLLQRYLDTHHVIQREIAFPFSMLLDSKGNLISIYFGSTTPERVAEASYLAQASHTTRYLAAIPYPGTVFDKKLRSVHLRMAKIFQGHVEPEYIWRLRQAGLPFFSDSPHYLIPHGGTAVQLGKHQDAIAHLKKALALTKNKALLIEAHDLLGVAYFDGKNMEEAREHFIESLKIKPSASAHYHLGLIDAQQGKLDPASKHLQLSILLSLEAKQHFPEPWNALHKLLLHQKENDAANQLRARGIKEKIWAGR